MDKQAREEQVNKQHLSLLLAYDLDSGMELVTIWGLQLSMVYSDMQQALSTCNHVFHSTHYDRCVLHEFQIKLSALADKTNSTVPSNQYHALADQEKSLENLRRRG